MSHFQAFSCGRIQRGARYISSALLLFIGCPGDAAGETWTRHTIDDRGEGADGVRLADVNGDGLADVVTGWEESGEVRVCLNPGVDAAGAPWPTARSRSSAGATRMVLKVGRASCLSFGRCPKSGDYRLPPSAKRQAGSPPHFLIFHLR